MTNNDVAPARPKGTFSWALWDWASQAFPTVVTSFIFGRYITSEFFAPAGYSIEEAGQYTAFWLGISGVFAGVLIALIAPIVGRRADTSGRKKFWLMINTYLFAATIGLMFFVAPSSDFFVFGLVLLAAGGIFFEFATVNYNSMLNEVARPHERGKISQFGWGLGYIGGIILLVMALWIIQFGGAELLGIPDTDALSVRVVMVISMFWVIIFSIPLMLKVPEAKPIAGTENEGVLLAYKKLIRSLITMRKENPNLLKFLIASAVYRDGLNGVFAYGAVLGGIAFGLDLTEIIMFGIALVLMGFGFSIFFPLTLEIILSKTRKGISGKIIGAYETIFGLGWAIGPTIGGPITQSFGDETPYIIFSIIGIGITILAIISRKKLEPLKISE
jgi:UMF1 family MFS transporter